MLRQGRQRGHAVGHVVGGVILRGGAGDRRRLAARRQQVERDIAQGAAAGAGRVGRIGAGDRHAVVDLGQRGAELARRYRRARRRGRGRSHRDRCRGRFRGRCRLRPAASAPARQRPARARRRREWRPCAAIRLSSLRGCLAGAQARDIVDQKPHRGGLQRLPAVERIAVMGGEKGEIGGVEIGDRA